MQHARLIDVQPTLFLHPTYLIIINEHRPWIRRYRNMKPYLLLHIPMQRQTLLCRQRIDPHSTNIQIVMLFRIPTNILVHFVQMSSQEQRIESIPFTLTMNILSSLPIIQTISPE
jgi:hypothetical protein